MSANNDQLHDKQGSILGLFARLFWMFFGNAVLFVSIVCIFEHKNGLFSPADVVFWITVVALVIIRYLDIKFCGGLTATGLPASISHWIKYVTLLLACSTAVWLLSHAVNYIFIK